MIKLFVAILAISDTGSISTHQVVTDFRNEDACMQVAASYGKPEGQKDGYTVFYVERTMEAMGHKVVIKSTAQCRYDYVNGPPPPPPGGIPAPVIGMFQGFIDGLR